MKKTVLYLGIDIDDRYFHYAVLNKETGELREGRSKPTAGNLLHRLNNYKTKSTILKCCYEASYCGYSLQRILSKHGFETEIIAPSSILRKSGKAIKTDRIDAIQLANQFANGQLQSVHIPDEQESQDRSLLRTRVFLVNQRKSLKQHILSLCRFNGFDYKAEHNSKE